MKINKRLARKFDGITGGATEGRIRLLQAGAKRYGLTPLLIRVEECSEVSEGLGLEARWWRAKPGFGLRLSGLGGGS